MVKSHENDVKFVLQANEQIPKAMKELLHKMMKEGMTPQEATELSPEFLESSYAHAYHLYNTGRYVEAAEAFRMLIIMNSMEFKYILGLAACFHRLKDFDNAIKTYTICSVIDPQDPLPSYHSSDCFLQQGDQLSAMVCLKRSITTAGDQPEFSNIKERALLSLEKLKLDLEEKGASLSEEEFKQSTEHNQL
jgi:type III secretion system low calcium response chaperone LcrH/SycD